MLQDGPLSISSRLFGPVFGAAPREGFPPGNSLPKFGFSRRYPSGSSEGTAPGGGLLDRGFLDRGLLDRGALPS